MLHMAAGTVIYGISGDAVWRIRNTHEDLASRPAAGPEIYGIFGDAVFATGDTHGDSTSRAGENADKIEESQSRVPIVSCFVGPLGVRVVRFAGGTPLRPRRTGNARRA